jgi:hypothetical protein
VVAYDNANAVEWPLAAIVEAYTIGVIGGYAERLTSPTLLAFGDREFEGRPNAHDHVPAFAACNDLTLFVLPNAYHCHNFANNRTLLWDRLAAWARP